MLRPRVSMARAIVNHSIQHSNLKQTKKRRFKLCRRIIKDIKTFVTAMGAVAYLVITTSNQTRTNACGAVQILGSKARTSSVREETGTRLVVDDNSKRDQVREWEYGEKMPCIRFSKRVSGAAMHPHLHRKCVLRISMETQAFNGTSCNNDECIASFENRTG